MKTSRKLMCLFVFVFLAIGFVQNAAATDVTITFEDLWTGSESSKGIVPDGYMGFNWKAVNGGINQPRTMTKDFYGLIGGYLYSGYTTGTTGHVSLTNRSELLPQDQPVHYLTISPTGSSFNQIFSFSADVTAAWSTGQTVTVEGFSGGLSGTEVFSKSYTVDYTAATTVSWDGSGGGVDTIKITSSGGTPNGDFGANGAFVSIDNIHMSVPEPSSFILLGCCLVGLVGLGRKLGVDLL